MTRYTVNIKEEAYSKIREYCKENALKINGWVEKILMDKLDEINKKTL